MYTVILEKEFESIIRNYHINHKKFENEETLHSTKKNISITKTLHAEANSSMVDFVRRISIDSKMSRVSRLRSQEENILKSDSLVLN